MSANNVGEVIYEVNAKTDKIEKQMQDINRKLESESHSGSGAFSEIWTGAARKVGEAFVEMGAKAIGAVKDLAMSSVQTGMEFEAEMSKVEAISGASAEAMQEITDKAKEMGATTKFTATEAGQAFEYMAMAGWKSEQMVAGIEPILNLAAAAGEDLGTTSDIVTDALTAFGLKAEDAGHFADVLAAASSNANTNVSMMGETFKYAAPIAGAMGYSIEDTAVAIGLMANAGIKSSQAGTSLRQIMSKLNGELELQGEKLGKVTIQTVNADGSMRELSDILEDCRGAFSQLSESEATAAAEALVGRNAMSGFLALVNAAPEDIEKLTSAVDNSSYSLDDLELTLRNTGNATLKAGENTRDMAKYIADSVKAGKSQGEILKGLQEQYGLSKFDGVTAFEAISAAMDESKGAAERMAETMQDNLQGQLTILSSAFDGLKLSIFDGLQKPLTDATKWATSSVTRITEAFQNGGIKGALGEIKTIFTDEIFPFLTDEVLPELGKFAEEMWNKGLEWITSLGNGWVENSGEIVGGMMEGITTFIGGLGEKLMEFSSVGMGFLVSLAEGFASAIPEFLAKIPELVSSAVGTLAGLLFNFIDSGWEIIKSLASGLWDNRHEILTKIWDTVTESWQKFLEYDWLGLGKRVLTDIKDGLWKVAQDLWEDLKSIGEKAGKWFSEIDWEQVGKDVITFILNGIKFLLWDIPNELMKIGEKAVKWVKEIDWLKLGKDIIGGIVNGIKAAPGAIKDAVLGLANGAWTGIKNFFGIRSPSRLMRETVGQPIGEGMAVGITDTKAEVAGAMDDLSATVYDTALNASVNYSLPDISGYAQDLGASLSYQSATTIEVPLYMDGREIARASAYYMGQQLAWEG